MATNAYPLLITLEYPPDVGGVANYYHNLLRCKVATRLDMPKPWWLMIPWLIGQVRLYNYSHVLVGQVLPLGTVALVVKLLTQKPYIVFTHGMDVLVPQTYWRKRWLLKRILRHAQHIVAASDYTKNLLFTFDRTLQNITVIHPAAHITPTTGVVKPAEPIPEKFILSVGRLVERKGFDRVIEALNKIPEIHYVIAGSGQDEPRLNELIKEYKLEKRVHILKNLSDQEIAYLYQHCTCLVMPARQLSNGDVEGFGIVALEANSFGKICIGGRSGGMSEAIQDGITGILVDPTNPADLIKALQRKNYAELESAAQHWVLNQTWEHRRQQFNDMLK
ncbi:MAG: glycosyltransferase family 4 protein [Patescibacteria group bacterium]